MTTVVYTQAFEFAAAELYETRITNIHAFPVEHESHMVASAQAGFEDHSR